MPEIPQLIAILESDVTQYETLLTTRFETGVLKIALNRPAVLNALSEQMARELQDALFDARETAARCVLITGAGRAFCSGADLSPGDDGAGFERDVGVSMDRGMNPVVEALFALPMPLVTAVNGIAAGAGCSLALAGDFVVAARSASFLQAFVNVGLVPDSGATWLLPWAIGRARALRMMMLGERIDAETAERWGLIHAVVDNDALDSEAMSLATRLAAGPTQALSEIRQLVRQAMDGSLTQALQLERQAQSRSGLTKDFKEGVAAFREKRPARFTGS